MAYTGLLLRDRAMPARLAATATMVIGLVALAGWAFDIQILTSIVPGSVEMKENTALALVLSGGALTVLARHASRRADLLAQTLGVAVALLALATLAEHFLRIDLQIDEFLFVDRIGGDEGFRGRMALLSAIALTAAGVALAAIPRRELRALVNVGSGLVLLIGIIALLEYLWNEGDLTTNRILPPVALNTSICFIVLGLGLLFSAPRSNGRLDEQLGTFAAVEVKVFAGFTVALALLLICGSFAYRTSVQFADSADWVAHSQEVRAALASLYGAVAGAEVALRDYILTADTAHAIEYERQADEIQKDLAGITRMTADNTQQQDTTARLTVVVTARVEGMRRTFSAYVDHGLDAARSIIAHGRKTNATQDVRALIDNMDTVERSLLEARQSKISTARHSTLISLLVTFAVATGLFIFLFRGIRREMLARRAAEAALRTSEQYNRSIVDSSPDCLGVLSLDARLTQLTPQGCRLLEVDDFRPLDGIDWLKIWKGTERIAATQAVAAARNGGHGRFQGFCPTLKGKPKWWDVIVMPILGADGKVESLLSVSRDISDVKHAENELVKANRFLDSLFESLPLMVFVKDAQTLEYVRMNRACEEGTGFSRERMRGKTAADLVSTAEAAVISANDREALASRSVVEIPEDIVETPLGVRTRRTMKLPIFDEEGKPRYLLGISMDITEQKLAEQSIRELNSALLAKAEQLETTNHELESFSYSVSHDLRAPLRAIDGFALMLEEDYHDNLDPEARRYLAVIRENSKRMGALIDDLLQLSRLGRLPVASHDINVEVLVREVVAEILNEQQNSANGLNKSAPVIDIGALPPARGDRALLRQVWTNLLSNAVKYSSKVAHPVIQVHGEVIGPETQYSVSDNGVGFDMAYVDKLYGVFQRLHRNDEFAGTGVGLAIVHRIVTRHGGRVWAEGKSEHGAVFSFALPKELRNG